MKNGILPAQKEGSKTGATTKKILKNRETAIHLFRLAKQRLLSINNWDKICGIASASFELTDEKGNMVVSEPKIGHYIRIKLPAPSNPDGEGYDWVIIEKIVNVKDHMTDQELFGYRVRPAENPTNTDKKTAHFYTNDATSSFLIYRYENIVAALERGRNEKPNTETKGWWNKIRNLMIALPGMLGLSKPQWKSLTDGLLKYQ
jgi:hypothetical protein